MAFSTRTNTASSNVIPPALLPPDDCQRLNRLPSELESIGLLIPAGALNTHHIRGCSNITAAPSAIPAAPHKVFRVTRHAPNRPEETLLDRQQLFRCPTFLQPIFRGQRHELSRFIDKLEQILTFVR